jgi:hypothetical protein
VQEELRGEQDSTPDRERGWETVTEEMLLDMKEQQGSGRGWRVTCQLSLPQTLSQEWVQS